jgi:hypothetical protein
MYCQMNRWGGMLIFWTCRFMSCSVDIIVCLWVNKDVMRVTMWISAWVGMLTMGCRIKVTVDMELLRILNQYFMQFME